jgi:hypothetical protein
MERALRAGRDREADGRTVRPATVAHYDPDAFVEVVAARGRAPVPDRDGRPDPDVAKHLDEEYGGNASGSGAM